MYIINNRVWAIFIRKSLYRSNKLNFIETVKLFKDQYLLCSILNFIVGDGRRITNCCVPSWSWSSGVDDAQLATCTYGARDDFRSFLPLSSPIVASPLRTFDSSAAYRGLRIHWLPAPSINSKWSQLQYWTSASSSRFRTGKMIWDIYLYINRRREFLTETRRLPVVRNE